MIKTKPLYEPTRAEIEQATAMIREAWSEHEHRRRYCYEQPERVEVRRVSIPGCEAELEYSE